jgi:hypothetical protein
VTLYDLTEAMALKVLVLFTDRRGAARRPLVR